MRIVDHRLEKEGERPLSFLESPNQGGPCEPKYLVMHYTAGPGAQQSIDWLTNPDARASAHLVVSREGEVTQLVPLDRVAWHAGVSRWHGLEGLNRHSIGIELDNAGRLHRQGDTWRSWFGREYPASEVIETRHRHESEPSGWHAFTEAQIEAALAVARTIVRRYGLRDILGHDDIAPGRKVDPGPAFPMAAFRARVLGRDADRPTTFETTTHLNIRQGPGTGTARLEGSPLAPGTRLEVLDRDAAWVRVDVLDEPDRSPDGDAPATDLQGWVHSRYIRPAG